MQKFQDTKLPAKDDFYSNLKADDITDEEYKHAQTIWREFNIQNLGEYSDLYLKTDVLLLVDVFQNFRKNCINTYGLDPGPYFTLPGYTWSCMLKYTKVRLELLADVDMLLMFEKGIRGGKCVNVTTRETINMSQILNQLVPRNIKSILTQLICTDLLRVSIYLMEIFVRYPQMKLKVLMRSRTVMRVL